MSVEFPPFERCWCGSGWGAKRTITESGPYKFWENDRGRHVDEPRMVNMLVCDACNLMVWQALTSIKASIGHGRTAYDLKNSGVSKPYDPST